jgi:hypothetical protein
MPDFKEIKTRLSSTFKEASSKNDAETFQRLATFFSQAETYLREEIQVLTRNDINVIIGKLDSNKPLTAQELDLLKLWIVGDAESYVKMENNLNDWFVEIKRIISEIEKFENLEFTLENVSTLRAILEDGNRVIYDIAFFLERKERMTKFKEATAELDSDERDLLSKLLRNKMQSSQY